jgi:t-SNARE complex subunit (syntaxin)
LVQRPQKKLGNAVRRNNNVELAADITHIAYEMHGISKKLEQMESKINYIETGMKQLLNAANPELFPAIDENAVQLQPDAEIQESLKAKEASADAAKLEHAKLFPVAAKQQQQPAVSENLAARLNLGSKKAKRGLPKTGNITVHKKARNKEDKMSALKEAKRL